MSVVNKIVNAATRPATWGFIGLGQMGYPMAKKLRLKLPQSENMVILDINRDVMARFVDETKHGNSGNANYVSLAENAREVAEKSDVLITCLPTVQIVKDTFNSITEKGPLQPVKQDRLFIDTSTVDTHFSRGIAESIRQTVGGHFVDAPVSGGAVGAQEGTLSFMFGSPVQSEEFIEYLKSIFQLMGTKTWHMGDQGCGVSAKLANNYILAINNIATAEALNMGRGWGLNLKNLTEPINSSTGHCWPMEVNNPVPGVVDSAPASNGYEPGCPVSMINKDLGLAMAGAKKYGLHTLLADTAREEYNTVDQDHRGRDFSIVYKFLENRFSKS